MKSDLIPSLEHALTSRKRRTIERSERAAVLVPLIDDDGPLRLLLTRRTEDLSTHQGQVAFPGGYVDQHDPDPETTALREAEEEVGLPRERVELLGLLDDHLTWQGTTVVTPVVGRVVDLPELRPKPAEVAHIFSIPIADLLQPDRWKTEERVVAGRKVRLHFFRHDGETLWGLSARIVVHMLEVSSLDSPVD